MNLFPKTVQGQGVYLFAILVMVAIMFTQAYGWFNWSKYLKHGTPQADPTN